MNINSARIRELRLARQWSQEQLSHLSGLNLRTIQRLESGANTSNESLRALASVFEVQANSLLKTENMASQPVLESIHSSILNGLNFNGRSPRSEFWWFVLAIILLLACAKLLSDILGSIPFQLVSLVVIVPWLAACTRRLRDAGFTPWWLLISLVPVVGIILLLYLLTYPTKVVAD